jgi:hypothetical protein
MSKVVRISDDLLNDLKVFIDNDKALDELLHKSLLSDEPYTYLIGELYGDDLNAWLKYIVKYAISCQKRTLDNEDK